MTAVIIIGAVLSAAVLWGISSYNGFVALRNKTEEAFSAMDVSLKKRYDLIPNYVETVKGYAKHESETLEKERMQNDNILTGSLRSLFAIAENYPDLKANTNFTELQNQLSEIEEEIAGARRYYNGVVNRYNTKAEMFPGNIIAKMFHFERKPLFEVEESEERKNVKVSF